MSDIHKHMELWKRRQFQAANETSRLRDIGRGVAHRLYPVLGTCERCRLRPAKHRHHIDENTRNNARSNVKFVCKECHYLEHVLLGTGDRKHAVMRHNKREYRRELRRCWVQELIDTSGLNHTIDEVVADPAVLSAVYTAAAWTVHPKWIAYRSPEEKDTIPPWSSKVEWENLRGMKRLVEQMRGELA